MNFGGISRKQISQGKVALFDRYIDSHNEIEASLIVDYIQESDTYLVQPPRRYRLNMNRGTAYSRFSKQRALNSRIICFLKNGLVGSVETRTFTSKFQLTTGSDVKAQKAPVGNSVLLLRSLDYNRIRAARILNYQEEGQLVVGPPEEFFSTVPEERIRRHIEQANLTRAWLIATLDQDNDVIEIEERPRGLIIKASSQRTV